MTDTVNPGAEAASGAEAIAENQQQQQQNPGPDAGTQKPADAGTALSADPAEAGKQKQAAPDWREDWRDRFASVAGKDDRDKVLKRLGRFTSPENIFKSYLEMERRLSSGELKRQLPADASEELKAEWRKENGLPASPEEYKFEFGDGFIPAEDDKPMLGEFAKTAHSLDLPPPVATKLARWYFDQQEAQRQDQFEADTKAKVGAEDALHGEWGPEYRMNMSGVANMLSTTFGADLAKEIPFARLADGTPLGSNVEIIKGLAAIARQINPGFGLMPTGTRDVGASIADELEAIRQVRLTDPQKYYGDQKMLARERELLSAQQQAAR